jgi:nucleoside-diphosphate-sugar epimerase
MKILVTGGTGFLGQHLVKALLADGHHVTLMGRSMAAAQALIMAGAVPMVADLRDAEQVQAACRGMEAVYHAGALSAPWGRYADFYAVNVEGTRAVVAGCLQHGVRRLLYVSSPSVVFDGHDQLNVTEAVPYPRRFTSPYSHTKKLGEDIVHDAALAGLETVTLRPKAIFGPGDQTLLPRLVAAARQGRLPQIGDGRNLVDLTYVENVVHALRLALHASAAIGKTYTITNDEHVPLWETIRLVLRRLGLSTTLRVLPLSVVLTAARLMELRAALTGKEPLLTRYSATILARTQTYDISAARNDLGYRPQRTVTEAIECTLAAWKEA